MSEEKPKRITMIASKGTLDSAYMPLIVGSTALAMDMEVAIFFTFYGLEIIKKNPNLQVSPIANPAAPPPIAAVPIGVPNIIGMLPGMTSVATIMMKGWMKAANVAPIPKLVDALVQGGARLIGCQMTMTIMGVKKEEFIDGVEIGGAATMLDHAADADMTFHF